MAREIRASMTPNQIKDFAKTPTAGLPTRVRRPNSTVGVGHPHANLGNYLHPKKVR